MKTKLSLIFSCAFAISAFSQNIINISDGNFKSKLIFSNSSNNLIAKNANGNWIKVDTNNDLQIQATEAQQVASLYLRASEISSLDGIQYFTNLKYLDVFSNNLSMLDLNQNSLLETLFCDNNKLTNLNINQLSKLEYLSASWNSLPGLILPTNVESVYLANNNLTNLVTNSNTGLKILRVENNPITILSLSNNINLEQLDFSTTSIKEINLSSNINLLSLTTSNNLSKLDVSKNTKLKTLLTNGTNLTSVDVRNGNNTNMLVARFGDTSSSPKLKCIFVDWKDSHILTNFWIKPYTATYVETEEECGLLDTSEKSKNMFVIFPNPVNKDLHFSSKINYTDYEIVNIEGRLIKSGKIHNHSIDVSSLISGKYILKLYNSITAITKQFIKQ